MSSSKLSTAPARQSNGSNVAHPHNNNSARLRHVMLSDPRQRLSHFQKQHNLPISTQPHCVGYTIRKNAGALDSSLLYSSISESTNGGVTWNEISWGTEWIFTYENSGAHIFRTLASICSFPPATVSAPRLWRLSQPRASRSVAQTAPICRARLIACGPLLAG